MLKKLTLITVGCVIATLTFNGPLFARSFNSCTQCGGGDQPKEEVTQEQPNQEPEISQVDEPSARFCRWHPTDKKWLDNKGESDSSDEASPVQARLAARSSNGFVALTRDDFLKKQWYCANGELAHHASDDVADENDFTSHEESAPQEVSTLDSPATKIYFPSDQVAIVEDRIFVYFNDKVMEATALLADQAGLYAYESALICI